MQIILYKATIHIESVTKLNNAELKCHGALIGEVANYMDY